MKANKITARIKIFFSTNLKLKVFSVIAAFIVWFVVMGTLNPAETHIFNINVSVAGEDQLKENNLICTNLDSIKDQNISVRVKATRADLNVLTSGKNSVSATIDLGRFSDYYNEDLSNPFYTSVIPNISVYSNAYEIVGYTPSGLNVELDRLTQFEVPVRVVIEKDIEEGYVRDELIPSAETVTVRGPEKLADSISYAGLPVDLSSISGERVLHVRPVLYTDEGVLANDNFEVLSPAIEVSAVVRKEGEIVINTPGTTGEPAPGYKVAEVSVSPNTIGVVSDRENVSEDPIELLPIDVSGANKSFTTVVGLDEILAARGLKPAAENAEVTVSVTLEKEGTTVANIKGSNINVIGLGQGLQLAHSPGDVAFEVYGSEALVKNATITGSIDLGGLGEGVHTVDVIPVLPPGVISSGRIRTQIELVKTPQSETADKNTQNATQSEQPNNSATGSDVDNTSNDNGSDTQEAGAVQTPESPNE